MLKEFKNILYILIIFLFIFFSFKYYFSDENKKRSYRTYESLNKKITLYSKQLLVLENDTNNIIEFNSGFNTENEIKRNLKDRLASFKVPLKVIQLSSLPKNAMGKVQKIELRKNFSHLYT